MKKHTPRRRSYRGIPHINLVFVNSPFFSIGLSQVENINAVFMPIQSQN